MKKTLILYYSLGGNTRRVAEMLHRQLGGDIAEIRTKIPYSGDYNDIVQQGKKEVDEGFLPEIYSISPSPSSYDQIILGSPVWWYTFAPAMHTALKSQNWAGKEIYPFATNGGWIGHTFQDFSRACAGAHVHAGLNVQFDTSELVTPERDIMRWVEKIK